MNNVSIREVDKLRQIAEGAAALPGHFYQRVITWGRGTPSAGIDRAFLNAWTPERALKALDVIAAATELHRYLTGDVPESNAVIDACYDRTEKAIAVWNDDLPDARSTVQEGK